MIELLKNLPSVALIIISVIFVTIADYYGKKWALTDNVLYLVYAVAGSTFSGLFYFPILFKQELVTSSIVWTVLSIFAFLIIGVLVYKETLTPVQIFGSLLGIVSIIILSK